jgi:23S rRNA (adenine-N6)-dimethyltransferase
MRPRSPHGGRHEFGQNHLIHRPTIARIADLVGATRGPVLEIGAGGGALTGALAALHRDVTAIDIDEHRVRHLRDRFPDVRIEHADVLRHPLDRAVVVGNVPFHLTTPILRRLLGRGGWTHAILLTQWEVARKRAGVGGGTVMTAQAAPWFEFGLHGRVPAACFAPRPSVDGGILSIDRRGSPLVPADQRRRYESFVHGVFTGAGRGMDGVLRRAGTRSAEVGRVLAACRIERDALPRDVRPEQWARLWTELGARRPIRR